MAFTFSSARRALPAAARSSAETAALGCFAVLVLWRLLDGPVFAAAAAGLACAWAVSSLSAAALAAVRGSGARAFWWAFGGGLTLRAAVFLALLAWAWSDPWRLQAGRWTAYALGVLLFLQLEYRSVIRD